jgi:hypothetical protein
VISFHSDLPVSPAHSLTRTLVAATVSQNNSPLTLTALVLEDEPLSRSLRGRETLQESRSDVFRACLDGFPLAITTSIARNAIESCILIRLKKLKTAEYVMNNSSTVSA